MPRECLKIIESKSKVRQSRNKAVVAKMSTSSSTQAVSSDVAELKDMVRALILDRKNQTPASAPVKAVEQSCVTCGGGHSYQNCPATNSNMYHDNIQEYVSQAAAANFNQANSGYRPPMVSNQIRPPGFPPVQNPHANSQNNFNRGNNFNQNRGNNFNQGKTRNPNPEPNVAPVVTTRRIGRTPLNETVQRHTKQATQRNWRPLADLMKFHVNLRLSLSELTPTCMTLELADRSIYRTDRNIAEYSFVKWEHSRSQLTSSCEITPSFGKEAITFNLDQTSKYTADYHHEDVNKIDVIEMACDEYSQESAISLLEEADSFLALEDDPTSSEVYPTYPGIRGGHS
ncbi:hypothetical protein Tco_0040091 [Tanacetum coccineum]